MNLFLWFPLISNFVGCNIMICMCGNKDIWLLLLLYLYLKHLWLQLITFQFSIINFSFYFLSILLLLLWNKNCVSYTTCFIRISKCSVLVENTLLWKKRSSLSDIANKIRPVEAIPPLHHSGWWSSNPFSNMNQLNEPHWKKLIFSAATSQLNSNPPVRFNPNRVGRAIN